MPTNVPPLNEDANRGGRDPDDARADGRAPRRTRCCAACHRIMDPIGSALENFDAVGAWRTRDGDSVTGRDADRRHGPAARRHQGRRRRHAAPGAAAPARDLRRHGDREADDLRARPRPAAATTCRRSARSCATRRQTNYRFSSHRPGHRQQHAVPETRDSRREPVGPNCDRGSR